jgi:hypothetical protein
MKSEEAVTTLSDSGDSASSPAAEGSVHSGGVLLIPKPSDDPRDPLVCPAPRGSHAVHIHLYNPKRY